MEEEQSEEGDDDGEQLSSVNHSEEGSVSGSGQEMENQ